MTSTQIKISADASAVTAALDAVNKKAAEVNATLNAGTVGIDAGDAQKQLDALVHTVEQLTEATKEAANAGAELDFDDVAKSAAEAAKQAEALGKAINQQGAGSGVQKTINDLKGLGDTIERVRKVQAVLAQEGIQLSRRQAIEAKKRYDEWRQSGAVGSGKIRNVQFDDFVGGGWRKMALAEIDARRFRRNVLGASGIDISSGGGSAAPAAPGPSRQPREPKELTPTKVKTLAQFAAGAVQDALGGVASTAIPGGGGIGGRIAGRGIAEAAGSEGGLFSMGGLGRMATGLGIGALAFGAVKAVGAIKDKVNDAQDEATAYTDLRHAIGQTETDFGLLRASLRDAVSGLGVANNEAVQLGSQFAKIAGIAPGGERALGDDVRTSTAFSRSYGLDPSQGIGLFASARHFGATSNDAENRRLAMMIGDAVGHAGSFAKMPDMIAAVEGFTQRAGRASLGAAPNMDSFLDQMSKLTGLRMTGLDTQGAANLVGQMTNAWHAGGGMGEASRNFRMRSMSNALPGFTAFDLDYINDSDPNSTVKQAFGPGSSAYRAAQSMNDKKRLAQLDAYVKKSGNRTLQDIDLDALFNSEYAKNPAVLAEAIHQHTGISVPQANAVIAARKQGRSVGMTEATLRGLGVDPSTMQADYSALAQLHGSSADNLRQMARGYLKDTSLTPALRSALKGRLDGATGESGAGVEMLRKSLIQIAATVGTPKDEGAQVREAVVDLKNITQDMASHLVPFTNDIRAGVLAMAEKIAGKSDERLKDVEDREFSPAERSLRSQYDDATKARDAAMQGAPNARMAEIDAQIAEFKLHHKGNDPATNIALKRLQDQRKQFESADYSAQQQAALDAANKKLADVREKIAKAAESGDAGIYFKDFAKRLGQNGPDGTQQAGQNLLAGHLGQAGGNGSQSEFVKKYGAAAQIAGKMLGVDPKVLLGQWALETGWGKSVVPGTNNLGNMKSADGTGVDAIDNQTGTLDKYQAFKSPEDFARAYAAYVRRKYPGAAGAGSNASKFFSALKAGGYATDPDYVSKAMATAGAVGSLPVDAPVPGGAGFGAMPLPASSVVGGVGGGMAGAMQRFAFEHKITLTDQHGRARHAPIFTTQLSNPTPSGVAS
jgi:flagellum-specific peptidoglycan hydrolase FlgJ